jgi:hypothetical protein
MPRPGFVLEVDRSTPPTLCWHGEGFKLLRLPTGSRVVYPPEPLAALNDPDQAIRQALLHPEGDMAPLPELLKPGMRLTIAFDDISLPLPPMERPDNRQRVIEAVLDLAAAGGVDDVVLICALALHRRMTPQELRHALGDRIYDAFAPQGLLLQHDAEDPSALVHLGVTDHGRISWSTSTSTWSPWTGATRASPPAWRRTRASAITTTCGPCSTAAASWTRPDPSCTPPIGGWDG